MCINLETIFYHFMEKYCWAPSKKVNPLFFKEFFWRTWIICKYLIQFLVKIKHLKLWKQTQHTAYCLCMLMAEDHEPSIGIKYQPLIGPDCRALYFACKAMGKTLVSWVYPNSMWCPWYVLTPRSFPILSTTNSTKRSLWEEEPNWQSPQHMSEYKPRIKSPP